MKNTLFRTLCGAAALLTSLMSFAASSDQPNVVVILVDDMGYGDAKAFNPDSKIPTPHINRLAEEGMRFRDAHAPGPLCHMSRYGLLTGKYPFRIDVNVWREKPLIEEGQMTIASLLKADGYRTAMVGKWHVGFLENGYENPLPGGPVDRGFDSFFGIRASTDIPPYFYIRGDRAVMPPTNTIEANGSEELGWTKIQGEFWREGGISPDLVLHDVLPRFSNEAIEVIESHSQNKESKEDPLMLYLAYPAPHTPWLPSEEFIGKSGASMYGDFLMMVDHEIGRVLGALEKAGMKEDTLVIFTSDNGPVWYEEDDKRFDHKGTGDFRGMKADAWEGGHRMPFIARWPAKVKAGSVNDNLVCFTDLLATFAEMRGIEIPNAAGPDSFSFYKSLVRKNGKAKRDTIVMKTGSGAMVIRSGKWKLIDRLGSGGFTKPNKIKPGPGDPEGQLYDMEADPGETKNLYLANPEIVSRLSKERDAIVASGRSR